MRKEFKDPTPEEAQIVIYKRLAAYYGYDRLEDFVLALKSEKCSIDKIPSYEELMAVN